MQILLVAATPFEVSPFREMLQQNTILDKEGNYNYGNLKIKFLITGVGMVATTFHLVKALLENKVDLVINAGVAGSFKKEIELGSVVQVVSDRFGDLGAEEADGNFIDLFDMDLQQPDDAPFQNKTLLHPHLGAQSFLPIANGITVNKVHGKESSIQSIQSKYPKADIETMEGAAVFYTCLQLQQNFLAIRSISNYVESRNKDNWDMPLAIKHLNEVLGEIVEVLG